MTRTASHPSPESLIRFVTGRSRRSKAREVVRHLLHGCRSCAHFGSRQLAAPFDEDVDESIFRQALQKPVEVA